MSALEKQCISLNRRDGRCDGVACAKYDARRTEKANRRLRRGLTYFAITEKLKDAWCGAGADRRTGDVHSGENRRVVVCVAVDEMEAWARSGAQALA